MQITNRMEGISTNKMSITYYTDKERIGNLGELLVVEFLGGIQSTNKYDTTGDICIGSDMVEVKTQNRHPTNGTFTINRNHTTNLIKCMKVGRLIFVEYDATDTVKIWECVDRDNFIEFTTRPTFKLPYGLNMLGWPISKMKLLHEVNRPKLAFQMRSLSSSAVFKK